MEIAVTLSPIRWNLPVRVKLIVLVGFLLAAISGFIYFYFPARLEHQARQHLEDKASSIVGMTAYTLVPAMLFDDSRTAAEVIQGARVVPDLVYLRVFTDTGEPFANFGSNDEPNLHQLVVPVRHQGRTLGRVEAGFAVTSVTESVERSRRAAAGISLLVFFVGCGLVYAIGSLVTAPLREIVAAALRIDSGDLTQRAQVRSGDEVGRLATTFNDMVDSVEERTERLHLEITERHRVESALRESENAKRALLNAIPDYMLRVDTQGTLLEARGAQSDFELTPRELLQKKLTDVLPRSASKIAMAAIHRVLTERQMVTVEMRLPFDRGLRHYETRIVPVANDQVLAIVRNITDQKLAERRLAEQQTLSMRSDRLRSLGEMAAGIAHELNQPLVGVRGLAEHTLIAMERGWDETEETQRGRLNEIVKQTDRMSHTIEHVRMFAREAGNAREEDISLNNVAKAASDLLGTQFSSHGLVLQTELDDDLPLIRGNEFSLEEAVLNLLTNARDAVSSTQDPDRATIMLRTLRTRSGQARVEVVDKGCGIPPDILDQIWQPFFTTKDPDKGTGLGLAITRTILEQFGGFVQVDSAVGEGTCISAEFSPVAPEPA
ncbi:MAG: HAMP domain-containing protein [Gemmatimonadetes bacterium]|nr:HAMP domain-containing protein [Gemmatimonadota bacterium]MBT5143081.1 HAMP domain-containing protein [Gemmatimonadota bacterium]MBT5588346.1 HAMP domain-containing protein [Gemmatimonadota bacterium]MBT5963506.1 HAMP domain-containing protein [Gemmatimonadota bacterium]MBT6630582.1 HAMP domain-containing protein [Gemmatimonadota bacterium]